MTRHLLAGHFEAASNEVQPMLPNETRTDIGFLTPEGRLKFRIGRALRDLSRFGITPSEIGFDLLVLAALVQAADTRISRSTESQDTWTREFRIVVPVSQPDRWRASSALLSDMLGFLTGDLWTLDFVLRPALSKKTVFAAAPQRTQFDQISLFSGGLDSLIGAIDVLESGGNPLLISHAAEGATSRAQERCLAGLKERYPGRSIERLRVWMKFPGNIVHGVKSESTTRGRSFLFIALAAAAGTGLGAPFKLHVPENGLIALNVPLDILRLGSLSTRTTHPYYLARWNELLGALGIAGAVSNPYGYRTKGEMALECRNDSALQALVPASMSCSSPAKARFVGHGIEHCGFCVPCLIRRAAIRKAWGRGADPTTYTRTDLGAAPLDTRRAEGQQVRSFQLAIARLRSKSGIEKLLIHKPGSLRDESAHLDELASVYRRGMEEVGALLEGVETKPS